MFCANFYCTYNGIMYLKFAVTSVLKRFLRFDGWEKVCLLPTSDMMVIDGINQAIYIFHDQFFSLFRITPKTSKNL